MGRGDSSDRVVFLPSKISKLNLSFEVKERAYSPSDSTVPAMLNCRRSLSARGEDDGSGQRQKQVLLGLRLSSQTKLA